MIKTPRVDPRLGTIQLLLLCNLLCNLNILSHPSLNQLFINIYDFIYKACNQFYSPREGCFTNVWPLRVWFGRVHRIKTKHIICTRLRHCVAYLQHPQLHRLTYPNPPMNTLHRSQGHLGGLHLFMNDLNFDKLPNSCIFLGN